MYFSTKPHGNMISHFLIFDFCLEWLALLWGPSWQEQACEWPEPCTWAGHRQGWPSKTPLKPFIGTCVDIQWVHGTCLDPVQESKTTWIVPLSTEKVELATAHATTRSFTWVDLWSPSWQEQACEWPEPCTWAGLRQGWPSKTPLKPFIGTCVDTQRVQGTCPDPVLGVLGYEKFGDVIFGDIHPLFYWWCDIGDVILVMWYSVIYYWI